MESPLLAETRRSRRLPQANPILVAIASEDYQVQHKAFTMDRSRRGMGIRARVQLSPGETIVIFHEDGPHSHTTPARVVWVREPKSRTGCLAGLECLSLSSA
jgi:hypothetical protein